MKAKYITPEINNIFLLTNDNIAQFVVCSYAVGEDTGLAKENFFNEDEDKVFEDRQITGYNIWNEE